MNLLSERAPTGPKRRLIAVFGLGLIGTAIVRALGETTSFTADRLRFRWSAAADTQADAKTLQELLTVRLSARGDDANCNELTVIWSAGRAGFTATEADISLELNAFRIVLDLVLSLHQTHPNLHLAFHFISSIGGLYEGIQNVDKAMTPSPVRAYGHLKLQQEQMLEQALSSARCEIYRLASVYDFPGVGYRMGLIPTLVHNGILNKVSTIVGAMGTQRDYVLASDVGRFIARQIFVDRLASGTTRWFLASGKPSTIYEVQNAVEWRLGRRILISFARDCIRDNSRDITVSPAALPAGWNPTDLLTGINLVTERMYLKGALTAHN